MSPQFTAKLVTSKINHMGSIKPYLICFSLLVFQSSVYAQNQEKYNLSFDNYDSINQVMPTGWYNTGGFKNVSGEKLGNGQHVGKIASDKEGKFGTFTYGIAANFIGDTVTLTGRVKHENVKGYVGLFMKISGYNGVLSFKTMEHLKIKGTKDWKEYTLKLPLSPNARAIYVSGILGGKGTAWFDDFSVTIDGKDIQTLENIPRIFLNDFDKGRFNAALDQSSTPIDLTTKDALSTSLDGLIESLADKRIVAIGESTHGTSEFYQLREIITKRLIEERGFNLVVLESPYDDIELFNKGLSEHPLDSLMIKHLLSIYQTQEMKSFLQWYKDNRFAYNIKFKGSDDSFWVFNKLLTDNIGVADDKELNQLLAKLRSNIAKGAKANGKKEIKINVAIYNNIISIEKRLENTGTLTESLKEILFNAKSTFMNYVNLSDKKPYKSRDELMADRISYLAQDPNNKTIIWAHNAHISKEVIVDNEIGLMGRDLVQEFGDSYHSIGLATLEGKYSFIAERLINGDHNYSEVLRQSDIQSIKIPLWTNSLASYGNYFYLDFSTLKNELKTDEIIGAVRLIGYGQERKTDTYWLQLLKAFDSLIFIKQTSATKPLRF